MWEKEKMAADSISSILNNVLKRFSSGMLKFLERVI